VGREKEEYGRDEPEKARYHQHPLPSPPVSQDAARVLEGYAGDGLDGEHKPQQLNGGPQILDVQAPIRPPQESREHEKGLGGHQDHNVPVAPEILDHVNRRTETGHNKPL